MTKDMILHTMTKKLVRNWRTRVLSAAHSSSLTCVLTQGRHLCADEITARRSRDYGSCSTRLRLVVLMLLMLTLGSVSVWGQTDYSGKYFLSGNNQGVNSYDIANTTTNYYLCPTVDWLYYDADADNYFTDVDNGQPFITTYQYRNGQNDASEAVWEFVKHPTLNYYYIKHNKTQKYLVSNQSIKTSGANRLRVHLEETAPTEQTLDNYLFTITYNNNSGYFNISPKYQYNKEGIKYLNITQGNQNSLKGTSAKNDGPTGDPKAPSGTLDYKNIGGTIGLWTNASDNTSKWYIELFTPEISVDNCTFTLSYPIEDNSVEIRYTTDGTAPTASSTLYTEPFTPGLDAVQIKVTAFKENIPAIKSPTASYNFSKLSVPTCELNQEKSKLSLNTPIVNGTIYYKTGGEVPTISDENEYTGPFSVTEGTIVKAFVAKQCNILSDIITHEVIKVATPTIELLENNKVKMSSTTQDVTIYYTIGDNLASLEDPKTSSYLYTSPLTVETGKFFKAIAMKAGCLNSSVAETSEAIKLKCAKPSFKREGRKLKISSSFPSSGCSIKYEIADNGGTPADPSSSSSTYSELLDLSSYTPPINVKAYVSATGYADSDNNSFTLSSWGTGTETDPYIISTQEEFNSFVDNVNTNANGEASKYYQLIVDVNGGSAITTPFKGCFVGVADDESGTFPTISGLSHPLFNSVNDGTVKDVFLKNITISQTGNVGAIAGMASGYTRIYNCGILPNDATNSIPSTVASTDGYCGGLVGWLKDDSRVINCFSYANITDGTDVAGIVGHVEAVSDENGSDAAVSGDNYVNLRTAVVNCMFYGDITGGSQVYPVYGGAKMLNKEANGINNYNFYRAKANINVGTRFNCSWPASEENLTRFEYYRYLLNSNRELCGWWVKSDVAPNTLSTIEVQAIEKDASLIAKWVLDPSIAPYPILKAPGKYPSVINQDPNKRINPETKTWMNRVESDNTIETNAAPDTKGQTLGSVEVTIVSGKGSSDSRTIKITAMDIDNNDFCYGKIQLPYYNEIFGNPSGTTWNEKYGGNYTSSVVTGWDITTSDGTAGTFSDDPITGNIFADRSSTAKDTHRVFAQGGYYYVPYGVGSITITAHWATAYYLGNGTDGYYDRVWFSNSQSGTAFAPAGTRSFSSGAFGGQTVNNSTIQDVLSSATAASTVYDCAIVLVGNHQYKNLTTAIDDSKKPFTIMSVDLDFDNEPDYCLEWQVGQGSTRAMIAPVRFDFLPVVELGVAMKEDASTNLFALGKLTPYGHFEVTETSVIHFGQFEYENSGRTIEAPVILNNGVYDQICRGTNGTNNQHITYFLLGGHLKMPSFTPGAHVTAQNSNTSRHCAVNVLGGEFTKFYLTGNYNNGVTPNEDDPHCYIDGGKLDMVASAAKEGINGSVYWKIAHAYIGEFYGGGISSDKRVTGNIEIYIDRSKVRKFCGGPMFGDMYDGKTVTTTATGTTFGVYYGAGNGGTCYSQYSRTENQNSFSLGSYTPTKYEENINGVTEMNGYHANYELELVNTSAGTDASLYYRTYLFAAQFATTNTGNVSNTLTDCVIETNFFGGGNLGGVTGSVTSELKGHTVVEGNVYGAGYSAKDLSVDVLPKTGYTAPKRDQNTAVISDPAYPNPTPYVWTNETTIGSTSLSTSSPTASSNNTNYLFTEVPLVNLGAVSQDVILTIGGTSEVHQNVFGGGEESGVDGNVFVTLKESANIDGNVFGGGNKGKVEGSTEVNIVAE